MKTPAAKTALTKTAGVKTAAFALGTGALFIVLFFTGLFAGSVTVPPAQALGVLVGQEPEGAAAQIILGIRLPRIVMAVVIGMMLAAAGTVSQAVFRNPLADPYIIGISSGAVAGASLAFVLGLPDIWYGVFAFAGSLGAAFLIFRLSAGRGKTGTATLLITGVALSAFLGAASSFVMYLAGQDSWRVMLWTMGYLGAASWYRTAILTAPLLLSLAWFFWRRHEIDALLLGDEEAHSLGIDVGRIKRQLLLIVSLSAAFAVAFAGLIGFVGLIVPHAVRLCVGTSHNRLLPLAACAGGVFLLAADILARTIMAPVEIPIGVITAIFGAPFFMFLAIRGSEK